MTPAMVTVTHGGSRGHGPVSNAARAPSTAVCTSSGPAAATRATGVSVCGETTSIRRPVLARTQLPPMNSSF
jgi:hypothetical protein